MAGDARSHDAFYCASNSETLKACGTLPRGDFLETALSWPGQRRYRWRAGEALVAEAIAAGAVEVEPFAVEDIDLQHADHINRKVENSARGRALGCEGQPAPRLDNFRNDRMMAMAGPNKARAAEEGTVRHIREGAHREPLT